jgi:hypothetical protein
MSATSAAVVPSKQPHPSARGPSHLPDQPRSKVIIDHLTSTSFATAHPQPVMVSPYTTPAVRLLVGWPASPSPETEPVPFYVHADLLTDISPFSQAAFGSSVSTSIGDGRASSTCGSTTGFKESQTRPMTLPEERPDDVRYLLHGRIGRPQCSLHMLWVAVHGD